MAIYIKLKSKPKTVRELLKSLFSYVNTNLVTNVTTYKDRKCKQIQCDSNKLRSFDDVLEVVNTYFPTVSYKTVFKILLTLKIPNSEKIFNLHMGHCQGIERIRLAYYVGNYPDYNNAKSQPKYESKYSWKELLNEIGIDSEDKLIDFIKNKK